MFCSSQNKWDVKLIPLTFARVVISKWSSSQLTNFDWRSLPGLLSNYWSLSIETRTLRRWYSFLHVNVNLRWPHIYTRKVTCWLYRTCSSFVCKEFTLPEHKDPCREMKLRKWCFSELEKRLMLIFRVQAAIMGRLSWQGGSSLEIQTDAVHAICQVSPSLPWLVSVTLCWLENGRGYGASWPFIMLYSPDSNKVEGVRWKDNIRTD